MIATNSLPLHKAYPSAQLKQARTYLLDCLKANRKHDWLPVMAGTWRELLDSVESEMRERGMEILNIRGNYKL